MKISQVRTLCASTAALLAAVAPIAAAVADRWGEREERPDVNASRARR
jgi:hypothetical protein